MNLKQFTYGFVTLLAVILGIQEQAFAKQPKQFKLERTVNVGYPQDELPNELFINGNPNPCYFQIELFGRNITQHYGSGVEPSIAVNPTDPRNIVVAWEQNNYSSGGGLEEGIAVTFDGGKSWKRVVVPFQLCDGGVSQVIGDSWLSFAPNGKLYLVVGTGNYTNSPDLPNQFAVTVTISEDGGETWGLPQSIFQSAATINNPAFPLPDKWSITADPNHKKNAYVIWDTFIPAGFSFNGPTFFSRTTDGGKTWTAGSLSYDMFPDLCTQGLSTCDQSFFTPITGQPNDPGEQTFDNVIIVLPKKSHKKATHTSNKAKRLSGHLLNFMNRIYPSPSATAEEYAADSGPITFFHSLQDLAQVRSQDQGANWNGTATVVVPNTDFAGNGNAISINPVVYTGGYNYDSDGNPTTGSGSLMRTGTSQFIHNTASYAVNPHNGFLYTVYQTGQFRSDFLPQIGLTTSRDGGYTWSERLRINQTPQDAPNPQAFTPFVAVTEDGYVGVLYTDFREDLVPLPNTSSETLTNTWLAIYKEVDGPGTTGIGLDFVQEIRLSNQSYIAQNGSLTGQGIMTNGDYSFLVTHKNTFFAAFTQSHEGPFTPPTLFFNDPAHDAKVFLDDNYRQTPYVSIVKPIKKYSCSSKRHSKH